METKNQLAVHTGEKTHDLLVLPQPVRLGFPPSAHAHALLVAPRWASPGLEASAHSTGSSLSAEPLPAATRPPHPTSSCLYGQLVLQPGEEGRGRKGLEMSSHHLPLLWQSQAPAEMGGFVVKVMLPASL